MASDRVRLHITPFNSDLLDRYIPPSLKPKATNISFHAIETFPERGFGYIELPVMDAQKLKSKLNGTVLKGSKVKIEEAKVEKKRKSEAGEEEVEVRKKVKKEKVKKEDGVIPGHELEEGRRVKRGWTEDTGSKKSKKKDKDGLKDKKLKFKTEVPLNKLPVGKGSKTKDKESDEKPKKAKAGKKPAVVKEFSKSTKPDTTRALSGKKGTLSYEDGTGWIDADGNVVEGEPPSKKRTRAQAAEAAQAVSQNEPAHEPSADAEEASSSEESSSEESDLESSSDESEEAEAEDDVDRQLNEAKNNAASNAASERERQHSTPIPSAEPGAPKEIHPLEALFKRAPPKTEEAAKPKKPSPIDTSFSFFTAGADDEDQDQPLVENNIPQTPHTRQDLEWRSLRSAAPTPDTAAIGKRFNFDFVGKDEVEDDEDSDMQDAGSPQGRAGAKDKNEKDESEFRKWFYDNRGDLNRSWKKRRREERKVVRQRENRRVSRRVA